MAARIQNADIRLDILIKRVKDYYLAHCLQFDLVATEESIEKVRESIVNLCLSHIENTIRNDNLAYLFSPAPQEVWAEYLALAKSASCEVISGPLGEEIASLPPFIDQEVVCHEQNAPVP